MATALVPTVDVIRRTGELGCNLLVVHEPIFYSTEDYPDWRAGGKNSVYEEKKALLDKYGITVWRDHDHMHAHNPIQYLQVLSSTLVGKTIIFLQKKFHKSPYGIPFELPETTVKELGQYLEDKLAMNGLRIVGNRRIKSAKLPLSGIFFRVLVRRAKPENTEQI
ncbi:Nif3-like dinuclear metal center hexameric protein [Gemmiger formicilis]|nr:Nif3-like dinuclear metal center hexameric protein [Gemmiger formicilis]